MSPRPHDLEDLWLAPVALELDAALDALAGLEAAQLAETIAVRINRDPGRADERRQAALDAVTHVVDLRHWTVSWDERGLAMSHEQHRLVLGVPRNVREYLDL